MVLCWCAGQLDRTQQIFHFQPQLGLTGKFPFGAAPTCLATLFFLFAPDTTNHPSSSPPVTISWFLCLGPGIPSGGRCCDWHQLAPAPAAPKWGSQLGYRNCVPERQSQRTLKVLTFVVDTEIALGQSDVAVLLLRAPRAWQRRLFLVHCWIKALQTVSCLNLYPIQLHHVSTTTHSRHFWIQDVTVRLLKISLYHVVGLGLKDFLILV